MYDCVLKMMDFVLKMSNVSVYRASERVRSGDAHDYVYLEALQVLQDTRAAGGSDGNSTIKILILC